MSVCLLLLVAALQERTMEALLRGLQSDDPEIRTQATAELLAGWKRWTKEDLSSLDEASLNSDPELSTRAADAGALILIRRTLGGPILEKIPGADQAFHTGSDAAKLDVLAKAKALWVGRELEDTSGLELLAGRAQWTDPNALARFLKQINRGGAFSIPADPEARARLRAREVERLGGEGRMKVGKVVEFLGDEAALVRSAALRAISGLRAAEQAPRIATLLKDPNASVRGEALAVLDAWGRKEYAPDFVVLLQDPSGALRRQAVEALGGWGQRDVAPQIAKLLQDPYAPSRAEAASALGGLGAREFVPQIAPLLGDSQVVVRRAAAFAVGRLGGRDFAPALQKLLVDRDSEVRISAVRSLGQLGPGPHLEHLVALLGDDDAEVREEAAWVLGFTASKELVLRVVDRLGDRDPEVRGGVVRMMGRLGLREYREAVGLLCTDPTVWVRSGAVESLGRLGGREDAERIAARLKDGDRRVRISAALALGELGTGDLQGVEKDADRLLGLAATLAVMRRGALPLKGQREALREIASNDLAFAVLGTAALETLSRIHSKEAWDRLGRPLTMAKPVDTWKDFAEALTAADLGLEVEGAFAIGRLDPRMQVTGREALEWLLGRLDAPAPVLEGRTLRLMDRRAALSFWQKRLDGR